MSKDTRRLGRTRRVVYQPHYETPKTKRQWRVSAFVRPLIYILLFLGAAYVVIISPLFQIRKITIRGNSVVVAGEVQKAVEQALSETPLSRNIIFLNTTQISDLIKSQNQQVASVRVDRSLPNGIVVIIREQDPALLWRSATKAYVVSNDGYAYSQTTNNINNLITVIDTSNLPVRLGQPIVPASFVSFVKDLQTKLPSLGIKLAQLNVGETTSEIVVATNSGYSIRLDTTRSSDDQLNDLKSTLDALKKQNKKITEYVDLRVPGKAFYK
ncbi:FtsQ-type POTRA domain-containing protein [Candidatus Saccharibacteria bacterium]|nr:FtsQ-type POTRA domain-containing protein [Candidatus Saccharibacteria bacterium]